MEACCPPLLVRSASICSICPQSGLNLPRRPSTCPQAGLNLPRRPSICPQAGLNLPWRSSICPQSSFNLPRCPSLCLQSGLNRTRSGGQEGFQLRAKNKQASKKTNKHHHHHHHPHHPSLVAESRTLRQGFSVHTEKSQPLALTHCTLGGAGGRSALPVGVGTPTCGRAWFQSTLRTRPGVDRGSASYHHHHYHHRRPLLLKIRKLLFTPLTKNQETVLYPSY